MLSSRRPTSKSFSGTAPSLDRIKDERYGHVKARKCSEAFLVNAEASRWSRKNRDGETPLRRTNSLPDCKEMNVLFKKSSKIGKNNNSNNFTPVKKTRSVSFAPEILLFNAVVENDVSELESLIRKYNVNVNHTSPCGLTAVHYAALEGGLECLQVLIDNGASIHVHDLQGCSPLDFAVRGGHFDCAAYLIKAGAEITKIINGMN